MENCYLFCDKRSLNNATSCYINVVKECLSSVGYEMKVVHKLKDMRTPSIIFVVASPSFVKAKLRFPKSRIIVWQQGADYEESKIKRPFLKRLGILVTEWLSVKYANMLLLTSNGMLEYYRGFAHYKKDNYVIMPCYNMPLGKRPQVEKYNVPTFVYAGSTAAWQAFDIMLDVFGKVEKTIPESKLFLYCKQDDSVLLKINKLGIKNVIFDYVPVEKLQKRLESYKYGFVLREKNWINYVSTPTKMNSYLSAYIIPIFSDAVEDFNSKIDLGEFTLKTNTPLQSEKIASMIINFEKSNHDYRLFQDKVEVVFNNHYQTSSYKKAIVAGLTKYIIR